MLWILFSLVFLYLPLTVLTAPTTTTLSCSLSNARLSVPPDQTALTAPTGSPSFIAVAIGVQNYTCNAASRTYTYVSISVTSSKCTDLCKRTEMLAPLRRCSIFLVTTTLPHSLPSRTTYIPFGLKHHPTSRLDSSSRLSAKIL
jgi:hypothetical protein